MSSKLSEIDPFETAKRIFNDEFLKESLDGDLRSVINTVLLNDGSVFLRQQIDWATFLQIVIEEEKLNHLDDKLVDSEDTLKDLILLVTQYAQATHHIYTFIRRYTFARVDPNPRHKAAYRDNFPDL